MSLIWISSCLMFSFYAPLVILFVPLHCSLVTSICWPFVVFSFKGGRYPVEFNCRYHRYFLFIVPFLVRAWVCGLVTRISRVIILVVSPSLWVCGLVARISLSLFSRYPLLLRSHLLVSLQDHWTSIITSTHYPFTMDVKHYFPIASTTVILSTGCEPLKSGQLSSLYLPL